MGDLFIQTRREFLAAGAMLAAGCRGKHAEGYRGFAYVAVTGSRSVAVVDLLLSFSVRRSIPVSCQPTHLIAHPDPSKAIAFVGGKADDGTAVLEQIDLTSGKAVARVSAGTGNLVVRKDHRGFIWTSAGDARLHAWSGANLGPMTQVSLASRAIDFDVAPNQPLACVCLEGGLAQFVNLATGKASAPVHLGADASAVRFRWDGRVAMVALRNESVLSVLDTASRRIMTELPLALRPDHFCFTSDGGQLFITGEGRDAIVIVYPYQTEVAQTSLSGRKPGQMACSSTPSYLFVSNPGAGSVSVFDTETQKVVAVTGVGVQPGPIVVTPDQQYALVLNQGSGDLGVIRIGSIKQGRARKAPLFTMIPVGGIPVAALVRSVGVG
jgi:YVTN family beta-propeller protein